MRKKPTQRRIRDAATPQVKLTGHYLMSEVEFTVSPCGSKDTTKFVLSWWQIHDMLANLRTINEHHAAGLEREAGCVRNSLQPRP